MAPDDSAEYAETLPLTLEDLSRLTKMKSRHCTMPIMILDAMLPKQKLSFKSYDPKFRDLIEYCLERQEQQDDDDRDGSNDRHQMGVLGFNPYTGKPLCRGVTVSFDDDDVEVDDASGAVQITATGEKRMEVQGEPWLDPTTESFYVADVEIIDGRPEEPMTEEQKEEAERLSKALPTLLSEWTRWVIKSKATDEIGLTARMASLGPIPEDVTDRALWTAAVVNPLPALGVCLEIRPAMLSCSNDLDRMILACQAVQSSIDHLSGKQKLF